PAFAIIQKSICGYHLELPDSAKLDKDSVNKIANDLLDFQFYLVGERSRYHFTLSRKLTHDSKQITKTQEAVSVNLDYLHLVEPRYNCHEIALAAGYLLKTKLKDHTCRST